MSVHTISDLYQMQSLPLSAKIRMTENRIRAWCDYWNDEVYVSFSGGKDSTVLVDIVTKLGYKDIPLVFVDTGLEYPEIREFVKGYGDRVTWLRPEMNFKKVIEKYGYPFISKEISGAIEETNQFLRKIKKQGGVEVPEDVCGFLYEQWEKGVDYGYPHKMPVRVLQMIGKVPHKEKGVYTGELSQMFNRSRWGFCLNMPYGQLSNKCCAVMKKQPMKKYAHETGRKPITAQMASESMARQSQWLKKGCNAFESKEPMSNPMSFWTEQDVLLYIKQNNLPICSVYGDIVEDLDGTEEVEGQMTISDVAGWEDQELFDAERLPLKTTGCNRTGCMFCGYGCHLEKESRFERMKQTHPKQYDYIMRPWEEGGLNYKEVIDWINEHGNLNIRY